MEHVMFVISDGPAQDLVPGPLLEQVKAWLAEAAPVRRYGQRLRPPSDSTVVRVRNGQVLVTDGPFAESSEWIAGFDVLDVDSIEAAVEIASHHPGARGRVEVRAAWPLELEA